tara:strand:- start:11132 stop:12388 length:1257 start_codon:yes stop_codon:yes gene_type:complete
MIETKHRKISDKFKLDHDLTSNNPNPDESKNLRTQLPITWHSAKNFYVFDKYGNKWIDLTSGIFATNAGHSNPKVNEAIKTQLDKNLSFSFLYPTEIRKEFTQKLLAISPGFEKVILLNTGSEATDMAYKMIKQSSGKRKYIICFEGSYHGRVLSGDFISGDSDSSEWSRVKDPDVIFIKFPYEMDTTFDTSILPPANEIAAFMIETYQGWGAWMYPDQYMRDLCKFAKENNILTCVDEIQAGFYRMGTLYGYMSYGDYLKPDIVCLGKAISSPLPLSAVLSTQALVDNTTRIGGTHAGNPLCCAAGIANINFLTDEKFQEELKEKVEIFENNFKNLEQYDSIKRVNVRGMIAGIIFHDEKIANEVVCKCVERGIMPVNTWSVSIKIGPPLTITTEALLEAIEVFENCIEEAEVESNG